MTMFMGKVRTRFPRTSSSNTSFYMVARLYIALTNVFSYPGEGSKVHSSNFNVPIAMLLTAGLKLV